MELKIMIDAVTRLVNLKKQETITEYDIKNEEEVIFKFLVNGHEEEDSCGIEETIKIMGIIETKTEEYWKDCEEEQAYIDQLNSDYAAVCCGGSQWN
jgi:hypothetical protein